MIKYIFNKVLGTIKDDYPLAVVDVHNMYAYNLENGKKALSMFHNLTLSEQFIQPLNSTVTQELMDLGIRPGHLVYCCEKRMNCGASFPHLKVILRELDLKEARHKEIDKKFNGVIVGELTGLSGKELGAFMTDFRKEFSDTFILSSSKVELERRIMIQKGFK